MQDYNTEKGRYLNGNSASAQISYLLLRGVKKLSRTSGDIMHSTGRTLSHAIQAIGNENLAALAAGAGVGILLYVSWADTVKNPPQPQVQYESQVLINPNKVMRLHVDPERDTRMISTGSRILVEWMGAGSKVPEMMPALTQAAYRISISREALQKLEKTAGETGLFGGIPPDVTPLRTAQDNLRNEIREFSAAIKAVRPTDRDIRTLLEITNRPTIDEEFGMETQAAEM